MKRAKRSSLYLLVVALLANGAARAAHSEDEIVTAEGSAPTAAASPTPGSPRSRLTNDGSEERADRRELLLAVGSDRAVDLNFEANAGAAGITIGNPQVVATTLVKIGDQRQVVFKPLKAGNTTVTVRDTDGTIRLVFAVNVAGNNLQKIQAEIRDLIRDIEGVNLRIVGSKVVIDGEALTPADYGRLLTVLQDKSYADWVLNLTTLSPMALQVISKRIQDDINQFAPNVRTRVVNGRIFLEGTVDNDSHFQRVERIASLYLPDIRPGGQLERADQTAQRQKERGIIQNFVSVNPPPPKKQEKLVRVTVHFVELAKDYNTVFGFKWQPGFTADPSISIGTTAAGSTGASTGTSFAGTISSLFPKLQSAQSAGFARVLKTGTLIVRSGQPASLNEQTAFPTTTLGPNGQAVSGQPVPIGLALAVTPLILGQSEDIQMELKLDQTNLVGRAPSGGAAPVTAKHEVQTRLYVKSGESAAVAGVNSSDVGTDFDKDDPAPGSFENGTSALFTLLHSKAYRKKKSQFVIFVTPQIVENASDGTDDLKRNFRVKVN